MMQVGWNEGVEARYRRIGLSRRVGFGARPAVIVVDFFYGMTDPTFPLGCDLSREIEATRRLLDLARRRGVPIVHTRNEYAPDGADGGTFLRKIPLLGELRPGSRWAQFDDRIAPQEGDYVIVKKGQSAFYGTHLQSLLQTLGVDTTIVTGVSTSGCVRATVVDAMQGGFRVIIPRQCVGDRSPEQAAASLLDMDAKNGDVVELDEVLAYVERLPVRQAERPGAAGSR
ncbi:MAG TPA: isochorismatase family protein [Bacillota bacterium]